VSCSWAPRILFSIDHGETWVGDGETAVFVDGFDIRGSGDVEGVYADYGFIGEGEEAGYEGKLVCWNARTGLKEAPLGAVLWLLSVKVFYLILICLPGKAKLASLELCHPEHNRWHCGLRNKNLVNLCRSRLRSLPTTRPNSKLVWSKSRPRIHILLSSEVLELLRFGSEARGREVMWT